MVRTIVPKPERRIGVPKQEETRREAKGFPLWEEAIPQCNKPKSVFLWAEILSAIKCSLPDGDVITPR